MTVSDNDPLRPTGGEPRKPQLPHMRPEDYIGGNADRRQGDINVPRANPGNAPVDYPPGTPPKTPRVDRPITGRTTPTNGHVDHPLDHISSTPASRPVPQQPRIERPHEVQQPRVRQEPIRREPEPPKHHMRWLPWLIGALVVLGLLTWGLRACTDNRDTNQVPPAPVSTAPAVPSSVNVNPQGVEPTGVESSVAREGGAVESSAAREGGGILSSVEAPISSVVPR